MAAFEIVRSLGLVCTFPVVFFANKQPDTRTWLSFQYAKQLPLSKSRCSLAPMYLQLPLHGKWPHAFVGERTRCIGPSEAKQKATRSDNPRYRDRKLGLRPLSFPKLWSGNGVNVSRRSGAASRHFN